MLSMKRPNLQVADMNEVKAASADLMLSRIDFHVKHVTTMRTFQLQCHNINRTNLTLHMSRVKIALKILRLRLQANANRLT